MKLSPNYERLLRTVHELKLADNELLRALLIREGFGFHAVRWATEVLLKRGLLHRLWKHRNPKFRMDRGSARQVFLLSGHGAEALGLEAKPAEKWFSYLKDPRREYILEHELMIARFHAACLKCGLEKWMQGEGTRIEGRGFRLTPDAFFKLDGRYYFLEADTGNERVDSDDTNRRTIVGKLRRYAVARRDEIPQEQFDIPGFSVVFVLPERPVADQPSGRERSVTSAFVGAQRHYKVRPDFFRCLSETHVMHTLATGEPLPVFEKSATLREPSAARPPLPSMDAPTHERDGV